MIVLLIVVQSVKCARKENAIVGSLTVERLISTKNE